MANFPQTRKPDYPVDTFVEEPDVLIHAHRDGSEQRRLRGAGSLGGFRFTMGGSLPLSTADKDEILAHWTGQDGTLTAFNWAHPETAANHVVRYARRPDVQHVAYGRFILQIEFVKVPA